MIVLFGENGKRRDDGFGDVCRVAFSKRQSERIIRPSLNVFGFVFASTHECVQRHFKRHAVCVFQKICKDLDFLFVFRFAIETQSFVGRLGRFFKNDRFLELFFLIGFLGTNGRL